MKNITDFNSFKDMKKRTSLVNEDVIAMGDLFKVRKSIDISVSLVNNFMKKVKDETGEKLEDRFGKQEIAEMIVDYLATNFLNIENFPVSIVMGTDYGKGVQPAQTQPAQTQPAQTQPIQTQPAQTPPEGQNVQAQATSQEVPAQENGQTQGGTQTQGGQPQGGQSQPQPSQEI